MENSTKKPYKISLSLPVRGVVDKVIPFTQEEINKVTKAEINTSVELKSAGIISPHGVSLFFFGFLLIG
jgi:hypothetical protein